MNRLNNRLDAPINKYRLNLRHLAAPHCFIWLGAAAATCAMFTQIPAPYNEIIQHIIEVPSVFFYEFIAIFILIYFVYFASGIVWLAITIPSLFAFALSLVNKIKIFLRGDPLMPSDIILGGEAFNIASASSIRLGIGSIILLILIIMCCAALALFIRFRRARASTRVIGCLLAIFFAGAAFFGLYSNEAIYSSIPIKGNEYNMVNEFNSRGLIFAFIYHIKDLNPGALKPDGYSIERAQDILAKYGDAGGDIYNYAGTVMDGANSFAPDIVFLMSEAFWDITAIDTLIFDGDDGINDPIPVFHALKDECITGEFFADVYGGGTDTTEYSVLTGHSIANFNNEIASAYKTLVRKNTDSIARTLKSSGYNAIALHPGYPWFYNRQNVYPWLGFDEFIDIGSFDEEADKSGNYVSDYAMTNKLIEIYEKYTGAETREGGGGGGSGGGSGGDGGGNNGGGSGGGGGSSGMMGPLFCFAVSIQNHGPYDAGYMYGEALNNYLTSPEITLSIKSDYAVSNYIKGIQDADKSLGRLTQYFDSIGRPMVLVFFGDHLPGLGSNFSAYNELGYPIGYNGGLNEASNIFRGRYLIWANNAAREQWPVYETAKVSTHRLSASYLGIYVLKCLGLELNAYENLVDAMHDELPVYHSLFHSTSEEDGAAVFDGEPGSLEDGAAVFGGELGSPANGAAYSDIAAIYGILEQYTHLNELLSEYKIAQYYKIFDEKVGEVK